ncbi:MAG TPA: methyltransferase domain-containing protein, partial [Candidatus Limnocylindrales bacterium]
MVPPPDEKAHRARALAYPATTTSGFDVVNANVQRARQHARSTGVDGRARFERLDAAGGLPDQYDLVTCFGVVHDAHDPLGLLRAVRAAVRPGGLCLIQEITSGERLADNRGPAATVLYGFSVLHCMTQSLAAGGPALGTCGLPESRLRELCLDAGFSSLRSAVSGPLDTL